MKIEIEARHPSVCTACGRHASQPFRRIVDGEVVEGCIDDFHTDAMLHLDLPDSSWHWRPEAINHRSDVSRFLARAGGSR